MKVRALFGDYENVERIEISANSIKIHLIFADNRPTEIIDWISVIQILDK